MADAAAHDELIERIARGDREAFARLYRQCRPDVYRFAVHMCGSSAVAEDIVQDVFVAVIEYATRYRPGGAGVVPWLLGIARNHVRRLQHRRPVVPIPDEDTEDGRRLALVRDPVAELTGRRRQAALARALTELPPRYREAIVLCDLHELSYEAAAGVLGCAIGTVRSRLHRGRALLFREVCEQERQVICALPAARQS